MLLCNIVFFMHIPLESGENIAFLYEIFTRPSLNLQQGLTCDSLFIRGGISILRGNGEVFKFFSEHYDRLLCEERILRG